MAKQKTKQVSMLPLIKPNDKLFIKKAKKLNIDDIAVFKKDNRLIAHRVIYKKAPHYYITKGDNNLQADGKIQKNEILGRIEKLERNGETITLKHVYLTQSLRYTVALEKLVKKLSREGVEHIFLKGLPIHLYIGKEPPKRLYFDADLLIRKVNFKKVNKILESLGYKRQTVRLFDKNTDDQTQYNYIKREAGYPIVIDLHLEPAIGFTKTPYFNKLFPNSKGLVNYLFENTKEIKSPGVKYNILVKEALLIYLLLHFFHHNFKGAHRMQTIIKLLENKNISWKKFYQVIDNFYLENIIYASLSVLFKYHSIKNIPEFKKQLKPSLGTKIALIVTLPFMNPFQEDSRVVSAVKRLLYLSVFSDHNLYKRLQILLNREAINFYFLTIKSFFLSRFRKASTSF